MKGNYKKILENKLTLVFIIAILLEFLTANVTICEIPVGVKRGDWIEYKVTTTGNPPEPFNVTWAKMQILNVEGPIIETNITTRAANGTLSSLIMTLNLEKGEVGAWFIIPANLKTGDSFLDSNGQHVIIQGEQQLTWAGDTRAITNATTPQRIKHWDKSTGVFVECVDVFNNYSINATAIKTNMWGNQDTIGSGIVSPGWLAIILAISAAAIGIYILGWKAKKFSYGK
jgi:hypothetical protein